MGAIVISSKDDDACAICGCKVVGGWNYVVSTAHPKPANVKQFTVHFHHLFGEPAILCKDCYRCLIDDLIQELLKEE